MSGKLTRDVFEKLIVENIDALRMHDDGKFISTLEGRHIIDVLKDAMRVYYEVEPERDRLRDAIVSHRAQKADDRCIEDDDRLYAALGDGIKCDRSVGDKEAMLKNCARFIERRCTGGAWPTYTELEKENIKLRYMLWLRHDAQHTGVLYGDDGEMQCAVCMLDFRRMSVKDIEQRFITIGMAKLAP